jgi:hypothetical protein
MHTRIPFVPESKLSTDGLTADRAGSEIFHTKFVA